MIAVIAQKGSRQVISSNQNSAGNFQSRLYVGNGETATPINATHKTLDGAKKWAAKVVSK